MRKEFFMKYHKYFSKAIGVFIFLFWALVSQAYGESFYITAIGGSDSNSGLSSSQAWATFNYAWSKLKPGDTLILKNGVYYQSLNPTMSGTQAAPITIRSENDGGAIIDGQSQRIPCSITGSETIRYTDLVIEGIKCQNSDKSVFNIWHSDRITVRRVSAYNSGPGNYQVFSLYLANDVLLEDTAASGSGRVLYNNYESARVTLRRCWGRWMSQLDHGTGPKLIIQIYGTDDSLIENCVGTMDQNLSDSVEGMAVWAHTYNDTADRNRFYGNVVYRLPNWAYRVSSAQHRIEGNRFINNVSIDNPYGFFQRGDADLRADKITMFSTTNLAFSVQASSGYEGYPKDSDYEINGDVRNSIFFSGGTGFSVNSSTYPINSFTNAYNDLHDLVKPYSGETSKGTGEIDVDPMFDVLQYGKGGYLIAPTALKTSGENGTQMGADVRYRYYDGMLTNSTLWPWSMEERIFKETGISVTWESQGGLWKTLDEVYPTEVSPDTTSPLPPTGLKAD
jgi:hypothetical protein